MTGTTKTILGVAAVVALAAGGYYLYQKKKSSPSSPVANAPASGGGSGANSSSSAAYNGPLNQIFSGASGLTDYLSGIGGSIGHLFNGNGGATTPTPATTSSDPVPSNDESGDFDYSIFD